MYNQPLAYNVYSDRAKTQWHWIINKGIIKTSSVPFNTEAEADKEMQDELTRMRKNDEITNKERFLALVSQEPSTWDKDCKRRKRLRHWNKLVQIYLVIKNKINNLLNG